MMGGPVVYFDADKNEAVCQYAVALKGEKLQECDGLSDPGTLALMYEFIGTMKEPTHSAPEFRASSTKSHFDYFGVDSTVKEEEIGNEEEVDEPLLFEYFGNDDLHAGNLGNKEGEELERISTNTPSEYSDNHDKRDFTVTTSIPLTRVPSKSTSQEVSTADSQRTVHEETNVSATRPPFESLVQTVAENIKKNLKPFYLFKQYNLFFLFTYKVIF